MKKILLLLLVLAAFASCKKEKGTQLKPDDPKAVSKHLVKEVYVYNNGAPEVTEYSYNAQNQLVRVSYSNDIDSFVYNSATSITCISRKKADNSLSYTKECTLDNSGRMTKVVYKNTAGVVSFIYEYSYDTNGYLTKEKYNQLIGTPYYYEREFTWADGNPVSSKFYTDGQFNKTREYTYDLTKINKTNRASAGIWASATWFGKGSKNYQISFKEKDKGNNLVWHNENAWTLDADGYPTKLDTHYPLLGKSGVTTYTYQ